MKTKKLLCLALALVMLFGLLPAGAAQAEEFALIEETEAAAPAIASEAPAPEEADGLLLVEAEEAAAPNPAIAPPAPTQAEPEEADGLEEAVRFNTPYEELPEYARQSQELIGLEETWVETWDELKTALADPGVMRIKMEEDVSFKQTWNKSEYERQFLLEVNGVKSLDLHGYTIYGIDDEAHFSTLFHIKEGAYLEIYDTTHGYRPGFTEAKQGRINYDGYIYSSGPARVRNLFQVDGTFVLNGGILDTGRAKSCKHYDSARARYVKGYAQVIGTGIRVVGDGQLIMNGGTVYGRGEENCAIELTGSKHCYINGGTAGTFGGGDTIKNTGAWLFVRSGYFFTSDLAGYFRTWDQSILLHDKSDHRYGRIGVSPYTDLDSVVTTDGVTATVTAKSEEWVKDDIMGQVVGDARPIISAPVTNRRYPELQGLYQCAIAGGYCVSLQYSWKIWDGSEWRWGRYVHDTPEVNVMTEWEDFTPEIGEGYHARCIVSEVGNGTLFTTIYPDMLFSVWNSRKPTIYTDLPDEVSFRSYTDLTLRVDAGGVGLSYQWEVCASEGTNWLPFGDGRGEAGATIKITPTQAWDGLKFRCRIIHAGGGEIVSNVCTLRYDDGAIRSVAFTTPHYRTYGEPYVPVGGTVLPTDVRCETSGVEITGVEWDTLEEPDGITSTFYGQIPHLTLSVRFSAPVADEVSVTLDGVPFDYSPYGTDNGLFSGRPYMGAYAWIMHTAKGEEDAEINTVSVTPQGSTERGYAIPNLHKVRMGYRGDGDSYDVRYTIDPDETTWACDGKPVEKYRDHFLGNANYQMVAILRANEGWRFTSASCVLMDGEPCKTKWIDDYTLVITRDFYWTQEDDDDFDNNDTTVGGSDKLPGDSDDNVTGDEDETFSWESESKKQLIELVTLTGSAPAPFQTCAALSPASMGFEDEYSNDARYSVKSTRWFCEGKEMLAEDLSEGYPGNLFVLDRGYEVVVTLTPGAGWKFTYECAAKFDDADMKAERLYDGDLEVRKSWRIDEEGEVSNSSEIYASPGFIHEDGAPEEYVFGTLTINTSFELTDDIAIENNEDGLVINTEKYIGLSTLSAEKSIFVLNGDTIITGPGILLLTSKVSDSRVGGPACIEVNDCRLTIRDTEVWLVGNVGLRGSGQAELVLQNCRVGTETRHGGIYGFNGGITFIDCEVVEPAEWLNETTSGIFSRYEANHPPVNDLVIKPCRNVHSLSIDQDPGEEEELVLYVGSSMNLSATVVYRDGTDSAVAWSSSDPDTLAVNEYGRITGLRDGTATVTAEVGGVSASVRVSVRSETVSVTGVSLGRSAVTVGEGTSIALKASVLPANASDKMVRWSINDSSVATLSLQAPGDPEDWVSSETPVLVTGVTPGESAVVTVETFDGSCTASCTVDVSAAYVGAAGVEIEGEQNFVLRPGDTRMLTANVLPANASDRSVRWSSTDPEIVSVDEDGVITAGGCGAAQIYAEVWHQNGYWVSDILDVFVQPAATGVSISAPASVVEVGKILRLSAYVYPGNAANRDVIWTSSDTDVATVDARGVVTAVGTGEGNNSATVAITCTTVDGSFTDELRLTVNAPPTRVESLTLSQYELTMPVGARKSIDVSIAPWNADNTEWTYTVTGSLATASPVRLEDVTGESCSVVADLPGTANIVFRSADRGLTARLRVKVIPAEDYVPVESVTIPESLILGVGDSLSIAAEIAPFNASNRVVLTNPSAPHDCIRVENGRIYALSEGWDSVDVYVDGVMSNACSVHVVKPVETLTLDAQSITLGFGESRTLVPTVEPLDAYDRSVTWTSADENVVTVDPDGTLHAVGYGTTYITAETGIFPLSTGCSVTVVNNAYDLYVYGTQVTDENSAALGYDPLTQTLSVSGEHSGGGTPLIRSGIDGLTVAFSDADLSGGAGVLRLEADTTLTGTADLYSGSTAPIYVSDGATLTLDGAALSVSGPMGILGDGTGEALSICDSSLSVSTMIEAADGFNSGITLSGCVLLDGCNVAGGGFITALGAVASNVEIVPTPAYGTPDFTLPAMIGTIGQEALVGIPASVVYIPDGCASIGVWAFRDCGNLSQIRVPDGCSIGAEAFAGCGTVFVFAPAGSPAESFCGDPANANCVFIELAAD